MKRILFLLFLLFIPIVSATVTYTGDCNVTCNVTTSYYTAKLTEGMIKDLNYTAISNLSWGYTGTTYGVAGVIYSGSFKLSDSITATTCTISNNNAYCSNANASNNITFEDSYIKVVSTATQGAFRTYMNTYMGTSSGIHSVSNGTTIVSTNQGLTDWDSKTGSASVNRTAYSSNAFIAFTWDETKTTDFDYTTNNSLSAPGIAIARSSEIAVNTSLTQYIKVLLINDSETGDDKILKPLQYFKNNPLYGDPITASDPCTYSGSGNWAITSGDCHITSGWTRVKP